MKVRAGILSFALAAPLWAGTLQHDNDLLKNIGFQQNLNSQAPLDLPFKDESGRTVRLGSYFGQRPVLLNLVYFECPMLCSEVLNGTIRTLKALPLKLGKDFNVVTVSFDPKDTPKMAAAKKANYIDKLGRPDAGSGWTFLTGPESSVKALADAVGFHYAYDPSTGQFAHASGIMLLTPEGRVSRYFYGVEYPVQDVRLGLVEASHGKIGTPVDQVLLFCFHYDPTTGRYGLLVMRLIRTAGALTLILLIGFVVIMLRRERVARLIKRNA